MIFLTIIFYTVLFVILVGLPLWLTTHNIINESMGMIGALTMLVFSFIVMIGNLTYGSQYILRNNKCYIKTTEISLYQMSDYGDNTYVVTTIDNDNEITYLVRCDTDNGPQYTEFNAKCSSIVEDNCSDPYIIYMHKWLNFPLNIIFPIGTYECDTYEIHVSMDKIKTLYY